jgi:hypothetical protein
VPPARGNGPSIGRLARGVLQPYGTRMRSFAFASAVSLVTPSARAAFSALVALAALAALVAGCAGYKGPDPTVGPNYSTNSSCAENCGNDTQCQATCTETRNPNIPLPVYTGK